MYTLYHNIDADIRMCDVMF